MSHIELESLLTAIRAEIRGSIADRRKAATVHYLVLKNAEALRSITAEEFCRRVDIEPTWAIEFKKMINLDRMIREKEGAVAGGRHETTDSPVGETITLRSWEEIRSFQRPGWIFRGQADSRWALKTSLERAAERNPVPDVRVLEDRLFREFRRIYHQYANHIPGEDSRVEWSSIMQHYGCPTRLLDFTYSVYIAAYFALEYALGDCAVWAIDARRINHRAAVLFSAAGRDSGAVERLTKIYEKSDLYESDTVHLAWPEPAVPAVRAVLPVNPFRLDQRLRIQQGVFLIPGDVGAPFMDNLESLPDIAGGVKKIIIPAGIRTEAIQDLFRMQLTRTSLFPGLDGFAQSLGVHNPAYNPFDWASDDA
jgi:hypothetical protein